VPKQSHTLGIATPSARNDNEKGRNDNERGRNDNKKVRNDGL
jgi:hypothetical protein